MTRAEQVRASKRYVVVAILAVVAAWIWQAALRPPATGRLEITFLSVGQGDCVFVRTPGGRTMLVDGGSEGSDDIGHRLIEPFLRREGVSRIDVLVLTHPHTDHLNGLSAVIADLRVGMVLDPGISHSSPFYRHFLTNLRSRHIPYQRASRGQVLNLGNGARAEVLNPPRVHLTGIEDDVNNNSIVLRLVCGRASVMLTGDAGRDAEDDMLESARDIRCHILKVGHHGSNDATSDAWLGAVRPRIAVISAGRNNPFGHPHAEVIARLSDRGIRVFRTDRDGAVRAEFRDGRWTVGGYLGSDRH